MKRIKSMRLRLAILLTVIGILLFNFSYAQEAHPDFNSPAYEKAIDQIIKDSGRKLSKKQIIQSLTTPFNQESKLPSSSNTVPTFEVTPLIEFVEFHGNDTALFNYSVNLQTYTDTTFVFSTADTWVEIGKKTLSGTDFKIPVTQNPDTLARYATVDVEITFTGSPNFVIDTVVYVLQGPAPSDTFLQVIPEYQEVSSDGEETDPFSIIYFNIDGWKVDKSTLSNEEKDWLETYPAGKYYDTTNNSIKFNVKQNTDTASRVITVTIKDTGSSGKTSELIIIQSGSDPFLQVIPEFKAATHSEISADFDIVKFNITGTLTVEEVTGGWIDASDVTINNDEINITFEVNDSTSSRLATVTVKDPTSGESDKLTIIQGGSNPYLKIIPEFKTVGHSETTAEFDIVKFNIPGTLTVEEVTGGWINSSDITLNNDDIHITFEVNNSPSSRFATITIKDPVSNKTDELTIIQGGNDPDLYAVPNFKVVGYRTQEVNIDIVSFNFTNWKVASKPDWIPKWYKDSDTKLRLDILSNLGPTRIGTVRVIKVGDPNVFSDIKIIQGSQSYPSILANPEKIVVDYKEQYSKTIEIIHFNINEWEFDENTFPWGINLSDSIRLSDTKFKLKVPLNQDDNYRLDSIKIREKGETTPYHWLKIYQGAEAESVILVTPEKLVADYKAQTTKPVEVIRFNINGFEVNSDLPYFLEDSDPYTIHPDSTITFYIKLNEEDTFRKDTIFIQEVGGNGPVDSILIYQGALAESVILATPETLVVDFEAHPTSNQVKIIYFNIEGWEVDDTNLPDFLDDTNPYTISYPDSTITFNIERNYEDTYREGTVTIQENNGSGISDQIKIIQGAEAVSSILVSPEVLIINHEGTPESAGIKIIHFNIESWEDDIDYIYPNDVNDWIPLVKHYAPADPFDSITLAINQNFTDDYREANVIIYETDNTDIADTIRVIQGAYSKPSILLYPKVQTVGHEEENTDEFHVVNFNIDDWRVVDKENLPYGITVIEPEDHTFEHGLVKFNVPANTEYSSRQAVITIEEIGGAPNVFDQLIIVQEAKPKAYLLAAPRVMTIDRVSGEYSFDVSYGNLTVDGWEVSNVEYETQDVGEWIPIDQIKNDPQTLLTFYAEANTYEKSREAIIHIEATDGILVVTDQVTVFQYSDTTSFILTSPREQVRWPEFEGQLETFVITRVNVDSVRYEIEFIQGDPFIFPIADHIPDGENITLNINSTNETLEVRKAKVRIFDVWTGAEDIVYVLQKSNAEPYIILDPAARDKIPNDTFTFQINTYSNLEEYHFIKGNNWFIVTHSSQNLSRDDSVNVTVYPNPLSYQNRTSTIDFYNGPDTTRFYLSQLPGPTITFNLSGEITFKEGNPTTLDTIEITAGSFHTDTLHWNDTTKKYEYTLAVESGFLGAIVPNSDFYYFVPPQWTIDAAGGVYEPIDTLHFDAYEINPTITINNVKEATIYLCKGDTLRKGKLNYPIINVSGIYQSADTVWRLIDNDPQTQATHYLSDSLLLQPHFFTDDTVLVELRVYIRNQVGNVIHIDSATLKIDVTKRPGKKEFLGPSDVCENQSGVVYYVKDNKAGEYFRWDLLNKKGIIKDEGYSNIAVIEWKSSGTETLVLRTIKNGCEAEQSFSRIINISDSDIARPSTIVRQKNNENFLYCEDTDAAYYKWGYYTMLNGNIDTVTFLPSKNDWYCRFDSIDKLDRINHRYFVITYNDPNGEHCGTTSFLDKDIPVDIEELATGEIEIYPNPTENIINIIFKATDISGPVNIEVFDLSGNRVYREKVEGLRNNDIYTIRDVYKFNRGLYIVHIGYADKSFQSKVIVR